MNRIVQIFISSTSKFKEQRWKALEGFCYNHRTFEKSSLLGNKVPSHKLNSLQLYAIKIYFLFTLNFQGCKEHLLQLNSVQVVIQAATMLCNHIFHILEVKETSRKFFKCQTREGHQTIVPPFNLPETLEVESILAKKCVSTQGTLSQVKYGLNARPQSKTTG